MIDALCSEPLLEACGSLNTALHLTSHRPNRPIRVRVFKYTILRLKLSRNGSEKKKKLIVIPIMTNVPLNAIITFLSDREEVN